jgi:hypothetical protein
MATPHIISAVICHPNPDIFEYQASVMANLSDGQENVLVFRFFDDELSFSPHEFIGKTLREAVDVFHDKDIAYLQS